VPDTVVPVYAGVEVDSGGIFTQIQIGIKDLISGEPKPGPSSEVIQLPESAEANAAPPAQ
jgi:hypothetical protein